VTIRRRGPDKDRDSPRVPTDLPSPSQELNASNDELRKDIERKLFAITIVL
jgi:hypothetical protein